MFLLSFPSFDVWRACIINQVVCSIPTNGRYVFQVTFNNTNFFYSIPTQVFTEKFTLADSRNTQGGSTISLLIKKRLLRHPRMHSHVYRRLLLADAQVSTRIPVSKQKGGHRLKYYSR